MSEISVVLMFVLILIIVGVLAYIITIFNGLVMLKNNIRKSWANIDVLLKQRSDEIPNLIETVKGYMRHEKKTLEAITQMRSQMMSAHSKHDMAQLNNQMSGAIKSLFAVAENYPKLQASANFLKLQERLTILENEIADRREFYNDSVTVYNIKIESFPDLFIARMFKYSREEPFSATEQEKKLVSAQMYA
jgi:LemA protein